MALGNATTVTIANGESLSTRAELGAGRAFAIQMPAAWTAASISFEGSLDGVTFAPVYDDAGDEIAVAASTSRIVVLDARLIGIRYLKVRSGLVGAAVNQGAARSLIIGTVD
jgi:hypothetical protein